MDIVKCGLKIISIALACVFLVWPVDFAFASIADGTIDRTRKYAWSENAGWINFGCSHCNVRITDPAITGYAWSDNYGWINLSPTHGGIRNNGEGDLSGFAWGENLGWINFDNVFIDTSGRFIGTAVGDISGRINFDCLNCDVRTDWRPRSVRPAGVVPLAQHIFPQAPEGGFRVLINNDARYTESPTVILSLFGGQDITRMAISNNPEFVGIGSTGQIPYQSSYQWNLCQGLISCPEGEYTVYVKFYAPGGTALEVVSDSIIYKKPIIAETPGIIERIREILESLIPEILKLRPPEIKPPIEIPIEELAPREAPLAFQGEWRLLPREPIKEFVFAPLPREIERLAEKFPELENLLGDIGVVRMADIERLRGVRLTLPGFAEKKEAVPTDIVFARTEGGLIDLNIALSVNEKGETEQRISTISDTTLQLLVRPKKPVESIRGYLILRGKRVAELRTDELISYSLLGSVLFALPSFAKTHNPAEIETRFVIMEFEYTDPDRDGIYIAEIQTPVVRGEYEVITVFDFKDPELGKKEIRLITLIDPEGYILERVNGRETRIPGAIVSIYWLNPETKKYELWPARRYLQENPQITDVTGAYSFLVPEGFYHLKVEAPGFLTYAGRPFQVREGGGIHINIELRPKDWWLRIIDWKIIVIIIFGLLLIYNFYRDKIREKSLKHKNFSVSK
jgi:hypothetical protein